MKFSSKHKDREQTFPVASFAAGLNQDMPPDQLPLNALTKCMNMKYVKNGNAISLGIRQGTEAISNTALPAAADILACTYYAAGSKYIIATASKIYYLDGDYDPVEIGAVSATPTFTEFHGKLIIHDGAATKAWDGTTFETLNDYITDEIVGTGDGATTEFTDTLEHLTVEATSLTIIFTDTTTKTIIDDGVGRLTGNVASAVVKNITGASKANPCVITCTGHGYIDDDVINIQSVGGMTQINDASYVITKVNDDSFSLNGVNSTAYTTYTSGGTASSNAINYTSGAIQFTCDGAPDDLTTVYATYEDHGGAPKSTAGLVRASRLYVWGSSDYPSRIYYTAPNDEDGWDSSSDGGYLDVDPLDGYDIVSVLNFFQSLVIFKDVGAHRVDNFPGDSVFRVEPLVQEISCKSAHAVSNDGNMISYMSNEGWVALAPSERFGDVQQEQMLSQSFSTLAKKYANSYARSEYNQLDKQFWIQLYDADESAYLDYIHVLCMDTGGQLTHYKFQFSHTCFKYVNNEMLLGGADGKLYRLLKTDTSYRDDGVIYTSDTYLRGVMTDFGLPKNRKHNKYINLLFAGGTSGATAELNIYINNNIDTGILFTEYLVIPETTQGILNTIHRKFNYSSVMWEITHICGSTGAQFNGLIFTGAIIGDAMEGRFR